MYKFIVIIAFIAVVQAGRIRRDAAKEPVAEIIKSLNDVTPDGGYSFMFEADDGSFREETAVPMNVGQDDAYLAITGSYRYIDADGEKVEVHYTADHKGFVPSGTNIPESISNAARAQAEANYEEEKPKGKH